MSFIWARSYGDGTRPEHETEVWYNDEVDIEGADVVVLDDIADTGRTLQAVKEKLEEYAPYSVATCALIAKEHCKIETDFVGFPNMPNDFYLGYGMGLGNDYRHLPYVCTYDELSNHPTR
jgi:hypoxanthine phosphoribosyltransferase